MKILIKGHCIYISKGWYYTKKQNMMVLLNLHLWALKREQFVLSDQRLKITNFS